jgi:hypothetical protein
LCRWRVKEMCPRRWTVGVMRDAWMSDGGRRYSCCAVCHSGATMSSSCCRRDFSSELNLPLREVTYLDLPPRAHAIRRGCFRVGSSCHQRCSSVCGQSRFRLRKAYRLRPESAPSSASDLLAQVVRGYSVSFGGNRGKGRLAVQARLKTHTEWPQVVSKWRLEPFAPLDTALRAYSGCSLGVSTDLYTL